MKNFLLSLLLLIVPVVALGQSIPNGTITQGQIWTPGQWNAAWQSKADVAMPVYAQTGTTYTTSSSDCNAQDTFNNASPIAVTLTNTANCHINLTNIGAGTVTVTPTSGTINGSSSLGIAQNSQCTVNYDGTNWQVIGCTALVSSGGSGTVNPATQYYFPYYSAAGSASTLSGVGCASTGFFEGSNSAPPTCVAPLAFPNLTAYSSPASGDLLLIGSAANSYATDQITLASLFNSVPTPLGLNPGNSSSPAWTTNGLVFTGTAATLTDTTSNGTVSIEAAAALPVYTIAASSATTLTNEATLYLSAPLAGTNVTATNKWSLYSAGNVNIFGNLTVQSASSLGATNMKELEMTGFGITAPSWTTTGLTLYGVAETLTDSSGTGTIGTEAAMAFGAYTIAASNAGVTITNLDELLLAAPLAGTNVTATNKWSLHTLGNILDAGQLYDTALSTGTNADFLCLASTGQFLLQASSCTISSRRFKRDIELLKDASAVMKLEPVFFQMKPTVPNHDRNYYHPQVGLTAENVAAVLPKCAVYEQDMKTPKSYRPECVMAYGVKLLQKHQLLLQDYERTLEQQQWEIGLLALWCALLTLPRALKLARARA